MPQCSCFHSYELTATGRSDYELAVPLEGTAKLEEVLASTSLAQVVSKELDRWSFSPLYKFSLTEVRDEMALGRFLDLLSSRIIIDLAPRLDECYALGPYTVFDKQEPAKSSVGDLINQAKYRRDTAAAIRLGEYLEAFIASHPRLRICSCITAPPKGDRSTPDLARQWAEQIASELGWQFVPTNKVRDTQPQKELGEAVTEEEAVARVANSVGVDGDWQEASVVILDDTLRSGGTMIDTGRAFREAGATRVFGLSAAKDARYTLGGIDLSKELWP